MPIPSWIDKALTLGAYLVERFWPKSDDPPAPTATQRDIAQQVAASETARQEGIRAAQLGKLLTLKVTCPDCGGTHMQDPKRTRTVCTHCGREFSFR